RERDEHHHDAHEERVEEPGRIARLPEQRAQVIERRRQIEDERIVLDVRGPDVQVGVLLEGRDHHPVEREDRERDEAENDRSMGDGGRRAAERGAHGHATTSARRDVRSMNTARTSSTGTRKMATAAPRPTSPPSTPSWNARLASTCVEL